ncbi:hypothetical protein BC828DRAFT_380461 [Blastocladiella britannica]|nr:hypothetical protein BC828DRAFT_380461 [Blastocladiella britannica]
MTALDIIEIAERVLAHAVVSAPSATAAIQALSVLPYAVTPSALPLVLARGDTTLLPHRAISSGNAWLLPLYPPAIIHQDLEATLSSASALGDLETVQWAWKHANRSEVRVRSPGIHAAVVDAALRCGQVPVLNWYLNTKSSSDDQVLVPERLLSDAISREHVHVMEFLVVTKALIPPMLPMTALKASAQGSVLVLDWMWSLVARGAAKLEMNDRILTQLLGEASREGHVRVLQWWRDHAWFQDDFTASMGTIGDQAARGGSLAVFDWWWDVLTQDHLSSNSSHQGYSIGTDRVLRIATAGGHDDIVAWYKSKASKLRVFSYTADGWSPQPLTWPIVC